MGDNWRRFVICFILYYHHYFHLVFKFVVISLKSICLWSHWPQRKFLLAYLYVYNIYKFSLDAECNVMTQRTNHKFKVLCLGWKMSSKRIYSLYVSFSLSQQSGPHLTKTVHFIEGWLKMPGASKRGDGSGILKKQKKIVVNRGLKRWKIILIQKARRTSCGNYSDFKYSM